MYMLHATLQKNVFFCDQVLQDTRNFIMSLINCSFQNYALYTGILFNFDPNKPLNNASTYHIVMVNEFYPILTNFSPPPLWASEQG